MNETSNSSFQSPDKYFSVYLDSELVGKIIIVHHDETKVPLQNTKIEFWANTLTNKRTKLGECITNSQGEFAIPFNLRAARTWHNHTIQLEIKSDSKYYFFNTSKKVPQYELFNSLPILKTDLIGLSYNLRTINLYTSKDGVIR